MVAALSRDGFDLHRGIFDEAALGALRLDADRIAREAGTACVRNLNQRSDLFSRVSRDQSLLRLIDQDLISIRGILFNKTAAANWPVAWHQDLTIAVAENFPGVDELQGYGPWSVKDGVTHVQAPINLLEKMVTVRIHLDPTGVDNGALRVVPGSHRLGKINSGSIADVRAAGETVCECAAGDVLLMSPLILHSSPRSIEVSHRRILHFEYAPEGALDARLSWSESAN